MYFYPQKLIFEFEPNDKKNGDKVASAQTHQFNENKSDKKKITNCKEKPIIE